MDRETMAKKLMFAASTSTAQPTDPARHSALLEDVWAMGGREPWLAAADAAIAECAQAARDAYRDGWTDGGVYENWDDVERAMQAMYRRSETCKKWGVS